MPPSIHVCPLCGELATHSDDWGWSVSCSHSPYESIEPVEVEGTRDGDRLIFLLPDAEEWKHTVGAEMLAKQEERDRRRAEWLALSCEERARRREERRAAMPPLALALEDNMRDVYGPSMVALMGFSETITVPCPRCRDAECENATVKKNPHYRPPIDLHGGFTIKTEGGSTA